MSLPLSHTNQMKHILSAWSNIRSAWLLNEKKNVILKNVIVVLTMYIPANEAKNNFNRTIFVEFNVQ